MIYRKDIDGLRALAVIPVILLHAGIDTFSGGFVGVDIFFVISGYLITSIIIKEYFEDNFSLKVFYQRRARRILPALCFMLLTTIPLSWMWMSPEQLKEHSNLLFSTLTFWSNILLQWEVDYFAAANETKPLLHTWSLSVEEQFYLFFPALVLLIGRHGFTTLFVAITFIASISLYLSIRWLIDDPAMSFYSIYTRAWELLVGALAALYQYKNPKGLHPKLSRIAQNLFPALGLSLILTAVFTYDNNTVFPGMSAFIPVLGCVLILLCGDHPSIVNRILKSRTLVFLGLISYSAYLWHQPIFAFARIRKTDHLNTFDIYALIALCFLVAFLSWKYIEQPFRKKHFMTSPALLIACTASYLTIFSFNVGVFTQSGFDQRTTAAGVSYSNTDIDYRLRPNFGLNRICSSATFKPELCQTDDHPELLIWGDSYAMHLVGGVLASNRNAKLTQATYSACGPLLGIAVIDIKLANKSAQDCISFNYSVLKWIKINPTIKYVILSSPFAKYLRPTSQVLTSEGVVPGSPVLAEAALRNTLNELKKLNIKAILISPPPSTGEKIGSCLRKSLMFSKSFDSCNISRKDYEEKQSSVHALLHNISTTNPVIWLEDAICDDEICKTTDGSTMIYRDKGHLSYEGSRLIGKKLNLYQKILTL